MTDPTPLAAPAMPAAAPFAEPDAALAALAKALAHPARLAILRTLAARGTCACGEVVDVLPLAQATVSQHLKALREAGLVRGTTEGTRSCYCLDGAALARAADAFAGLFAGLEAGACTCDAGGCSTACACHG